MTDEILLAERFEAERPRLRGIALRMLGNEHAADDAVQEAWLRLVRTDKSGRADRQPARLADDRRVADLPRRAALAVRRTARRPGPTRPTSSTPR